MKGRTLTGLLALGGLMFAGAPASGQVTAPWPLVHRAKDAATGAELRIYKGSSRELQLEVEDANVLIRKRVLPTRIELLVSAGAERLTMAVEPGAVTMTGPGGRVRATAATPDELARAKAMFAQSPAVASAAALLARVKVRQDTPLFQSLLTTRALLESSRGERGAARELDEWNQGLRDRTVVRRVSLTQAGPGDCWNLYAIEAIRAYIDYEQCMYAEQWWDLWGMTLCAFLYDLRAIGAFVWWLNCVGILPVS